MNDAGARERAAGVGCGSVVWGGGDFSGGMGVKSAGGGVRAALRVVLLSHVTSLCVCWR
jgi:hypothetical protein